MKKIAKKLITIILSFTFLFGNMSTIFAETYGTTEGGIKYFIENEEVVITGWTIRSEFKDIVIPDYIENCPVVGIEAHAFDEFIIPIESVKLPNTLKWIEHHAFYNQFELKSIEIPDSVTYIGSYAFAKCNSLEEVKLSSSLKIIRKSCFSDTAIEKIYIPENVETIESEAFARSTIKDIEFSKGLKKLDGQVFLGCNSLVEINLPEGLEEIDSSFWSCKSLETVSIPSTVISLGQNTFNNCPNLKTVKLSEGILGIANNAFTHCENLENINLPNSLLDIGSQNFQNTNIKNIVLPNKLKIITGSLFFNCKNLESVEIPDSVTYIESSAFAGCSNLSEVKLNEGLKYIKQAAFKNCTSLKDISLPSTVLGVYWSAFENCGQLEVVELNNKIESIDNFTFKNCSSLKEIQIPDSVKRISSGAFLGSTNLEKIVIPKSVTYIADGNDFEEEFAFKDCKNLTIYGYKNSAAEEIAIKENINFVPFTDIIPQKVKNLKVSNTSTTYLTLKWDEVADNNVSGYEIYRSTSSTGTYSLVNTVVGKNSYIDSGLGACKTYYYKIRSYKIVNKEKVYGDYSSIVYGTTKLSTPIINATASTYSSNKITWNKISGASGYEVYRATSQGGTYSLKKSVTSGSTLSYTNTSLTTGKTYYYKVKAYRIVNGSRVYSSYSSIVSAKPSLSTPSINLSAGNKKAYVKWSKISGASGYEIYRGTSKRGTYPKVKTITSGSIVSYINSSLTSKKTYYYKVRAYRIVNGNKVYSSFSTIKNIKVK